MTIKSSDEKQTTKRDIINIFDWFAVKCMICSKSYNTEDTLMSMVKMHVYNHMCVSDN